MKKKILSFLLCLCMVAVLLPTTALAAETAGPYGYAYDVQRKQLSDNNIKLWDLAAPKNSNGNDYSTSEGEWTLTRVGTYSYVKVNVNDDKLHPTYLESIVTSVATKYSISDKNTIVIHELKESGTDTHIAYGVIIANDQTNGNVLFIGDSLSGSGAGYLLSQNEITANSVTVTAGMIATDFVEQTASIVLAPAGDYTFPAATEGYGEQTPLTVTVTNMGTVATGSLDVNFTDNSAQFVLSTNTIGSIALDGPVEFTITPKTGLTAGTYTATVTVSGTGTNVDAQKIEVSFTVNPASQSTPVVIIVPDDTTNTTDPAKNPETGDNSTHLLWAVMASSALCAAALLFSSRRRGEEMQ